MDSSLVYLIIGGGAAGFFSAITAKEENPAVEVLLFEKGSEVLTKVKISGGGRCNVTHAVFDPKILSQNYPRGHKELLGPLNRFQPLDTIEWFKKRGVTLKKEEDGRMFPDTDSSSTIINCLKEQAKKLGVKILTKTGIKEIKKEKDFFSLVSDDGQIFHGKALIIATGSSRQGYQFAKAFSHTIVDPVPSLFTFKISDSLFKDLQGISMPYVHASLPKWNLSQKGPLLITEWGLSGPAVLKLSAWGARVLYEEKYQTNLKIDWLPNDTTNEIMETFNRYQKESSSKNMFNDFPFPFPKRLLKAILIHLDFEEGIKWQSLSKSKKNTLCSFLKESEFQIEGKGPFKEEFVTAGGVNCKEIDWKTMESRLCKGLFFVGEVLNVDGITGGFNFQNAWTTGWIAGKGIANLYQ